jgi:hypothetical protein
MRSSIRRLTVPAAVAAIAATGFVATAGPAMASLSDCATNHVCIWSGSNGTGTKVFDQSGTLLHDNPDTFFGMTPAGTVGSSNNRSLGRMCIYNSNLQVTNILLAQTAGNLANHSGNWVKYCP